MKTDFSKYEFRCSQLSKITGGTLMPATDLQKEISELLEEKLTLKSKTGRTVKWTEAKQKSLDSKQAKLNEMVVVNGLIIPKTMLSELRKIYRMEKYNRNFPFTNQYIQKGIQQEEEAITFYQNFKNRDGLKHLFTKNTTRLRNGWLSGEPDMFSGSDIMKCKEGFDSKCSWSLETFPFAEDPLDDAYENQNHGYMWLTGAEKWTTAYILVNATEHQVFNEKQKWFYALQCPNDADDKYWEDYKIKCAEVEKMMIYDYERFIEQYPAHDMEISKDEWFGEGYDIPIEERVIEKVTARDEKRFDFFKERIEIGREYMSILNETI